MDAGYTFVSHLQTAFNPGWFALLKHDPVHPPGPLRALNRRYAKDRLVFAAVRGDEPLAMVQVALRDEYPQRADELWDPEIETGPHKQAVFYSVFRLPWVQPLKGLAELLIIEAARQVLALHPSIERFATLSPIPSLSKRLPQTAGAGEVLQLLQGAGDPVARFHMNNGAKPVAVWPRADDSHQRQSESYGWMATYQYDVA